MSSGLFPDLEYLLHSAPPFSFNDRTNFLAFSKRGIIDGYIPKNINATFLSIYGNLIFFVLCVLTLFLGRLFKN